MHAGLDFGTTNSACAYTKDGKISLTYFDDAETMLPSALYTERSMIAVSEIDEKELNKRIQKEFKERLDHVEAVREVEEKRIDDKLKELEAGLLEHVGDAGRLEDGRTIEQALSDEKEVLGGELRNLLDRLSVSRDDIAAIERGAMRREQAAIAQRKFEAQSLSDVLNSENDSFFGKEAIYRHLTDPLAGFFVKSPKTFLGSDISDQHLAVFTEVIARILSYIRSQAESQANDTVQDIVLGRPVNFQGGKGNEQALRLLRTAAAEAGFKNVEFQFEPVAAALDFESTLERDSIVLVVDAGGGTTDCTVMNLGPSYNGLSDRSSSILSFSGKRIGGINLDIQLAMTSIMPHFGKDRCALSNTHYWDAVSINDVNAQARFYSNSAKQEIKAKANGSYLNRLISLHEKRLTYRLNRSAELSKIALSEKDSVTLPLNYVENGFTIPITIEEYSEAIQGNLREISELIDDAVQMAGVMPDYILVTGGSAMSPIFRNAVLSKYHDAELVSDNYFESVVTGLAKWANTLFK